MKHSTYFEAPQSGLVLTNAILLYQAPSTGERYQPGAPAFASIHPVEMHDSAPVIGAGAPLSRAHLDQWTDVLGKGAAPEILPSTILVAHQDMIAWWVPEQVRPAYFALSKPPARMKALTKRTALPVPYPAHLFVATRSSLGVYALPTSERPTPETQLLHSPILNVFLNGTLCWGDIPQPKTIAVSSIPEYERAVFDSWSTHANPGQELTVAGKGGLVRLWDDLAANRATRFPVERMKPFRLSDLGRLVGEPVTLSRIISRSAR